MVIDTCQLKGKGDWLSEFLQQATHVGLNSVEAFDLLVIVHEHVAIDLVDEDFVPNVMLDLTGLLDNFEQLLTGAFIIGVMSINDIDQRATVLNMLNRVRLEHVVSWEINHIELDVIVIADRLCFDIAGWQQEECLVRTHLLEDDLGDACLTRSDANRKLEISLKTYLGIPMRQMFMTF